MGYGKGACCFVTSLMLLSAVSFISIPGSEGAVSYSMHSPIIIFGDSGFTNSSGVVWGSGTATDPYIIEGWEINTSSDIGIRITRTTAHFEIRNVFIHGTSGSYGGDGIRMEYVSNGRITGCELSNNWESVFMLSCSDMRVSHCNVSNNLVGISVFQWGSRITVDGNHLWANQEGGVFILDSRGVVLNSNVFDDDGIVLFGSSPDDFSTHTIPENNTVNGLPVRYYRNQIGLEVDSVLTGQMIVANCSDIWIHGIDARNTTCGIAAHFVRDSSFTDNVLKGDDRGLFLDTCQNITVSRTNASENVELGVLLDLCKNCLISNNMFTANEDGVGAQNSFDIVIANNSCMSNSRSGILLTGGGRILVSNNLIVANLDTGLHASSVHDSKCIENDIQSNSFSGIETFSCQDFIIAKNNISGSPANGIIDYESTNTRVIYNNITGNWIIFQIYNSTNLTIYHNNIEVTAGDVFYITGGDSTRWNDSYPSGGNYWSNYHGSDAKSGSGQDLPGSDGIGDKPYSIEAGSQDWYPLMDPVSFPSNSPPKSSFMASPGSGSTSTVFVFDASRCWDVEDFSSALEVRWDWNGDGIWDTGWSTKKVALHTFSSLGINNVTLEVRDNGNLTDSTAMQIEVSEPPIPAFSANNTTPCVLEEITFSCFVTGLNDDMLGYTFDFGDGSYACVNATLNTVVNVQHAYASIGVYDAYVSITDYQTMLVTFGPLTIEVSQWRFILQLVQGWNFVTVPTIKTPSYKASTLELPRSSVVCDFDPATQKYRAYIVLSGPPLPDFDIANSTGYWIYAPSSMTLYFYGAIPTTAQSRSVTLPASGGWFIAGFNTLNTTMKASDIRTMFTGGSVTTVASFDPITKTYKTWVFGGPPPTDYSLVPGHAYWCYATASGMLTYTP